LEVIGGQPLCMCGPCRRTGWGLLGGSPSACVDPAVDLVGGYWGAAPLHVWTLP